VAVVLLLVAAFVGLSILNNVLNPVVSLSVWVTNDARDGVVVELAGASPKLVSAGGSGLVYSYHKTLDLPSRQVSLRSADCRVFAVIDLQEPRTLITFTNDHAVEVVHGAYLTDMDERGQVSMAEDCP
jgi:hypothetical protein